MSEIVEMILKAFHLFIHNILEAIKLPLGDVLCSFFLSKARLNFPLNARHGIFSRLKIISFKSSKTKRDFLKAIISNAALVMHNSKQS